MRMKYNEEIAKHDCPQLEMRRYRQYQYHRDSLKEIVKMRNKIETWDAKMRNTRRI